MSEIKVVCPKCGAEYLLDEIFVASDILGKHKSIEKSKNGKIDWFSSEIKPTYKEEFICDYCDNLFNIELKLDVSTSSNEDYDFDKDFSIKI